MDLETKNPPAASRAATAGEMIHAEQLTAASFAHKQTKIKRILAELARGGTLHRFQAELLHDHCLHSTVSKIQEYGIRVDREMITVPGFGGHPTRVAKYWLDAENRELAARLLGFSHGL